MRPRLASGVSRRNLLDDEEVVQAPDARTAVILNGMGAAVADLCDGTRTVDEIATFLAAHLGDAPSIERVREDVERILDELGRVGIVESV